jgi:predicted transglutaminase-like cysteine proteinase
MSTEVQRQCTTRHQARYWTPIVGVLLTSLLAPVQSQPSVRSDRSTESYSSEIAAVSYLVDSAHPAAQEPTPPARTSEQPTLFGMDTELLAQGDVLNKWNRVRAEIARELQIVDRCRRDNVCSAGAQRLIDLSSEGAGRNGRVRLGFINRAVDLAITPVSDARQWRVPDHWSTPLETLQSGRGDCEDYAILKFLALLDAGISPADLKIVLMRSIFPKEDHAVVAARDGGEWLILDNRTLMLVRDTNLTRAVPVFVLDEAGAWRFLPRSRATRTTPGWAS